MKRLKVINISDSPIGLFNVEDGRVEQDNVNPDDYRIVSELTSQMKRLADPSLRIIKVVTEEGNV